MHSKLLITLFPDFLLVLIYSGPMEPKKRQINEDLDFAKVRETVFDHNQAERDMQGLAKTYGNSSTLITPEMARNQANIRKVYKQAPDMPVSADAYARAVRGEKPAIIDRSEELRKRLGMPN